MYTRHGDVLLEAVKKLPKGAKKLDATICGCATFQPCAKHAIFAHGEVSGHVHQAIIEREDSAPALEFYEAEGVLYAKNISDLPAHIVQSHGVASPGDIEHLEKCYQAEGLHAPIREAIAPGQVVKVDFPQEYNWWSGEIERARD